ncbi:MAG: Fic family protein, partial [Gemmatimonadota bacterium]|nr:Fic family protein [Gemmatimonadota bacterium]
MKKADRQAELDSLVVLAGEFPRGAAIEELFAQIGTSVSRRTLQRRLAALVAEGRLVTAGEGRALKYDLPGPTNAATGIAKGAATANVTGSATLALTANATAEVYVPISPEATAIKRYVRQSPSGRTPTTYKVSFLDAYVPNVTSYLPPELRDQFHQLGRSPRGEAPAGTFAREILDRLLIDLSWASSRLEGNTYTRLDTERLIQAGQVAEGKDALETQMILNHKAAIQYLVNNAEDIAIDRRTIVALHALLSDGLLADPMACGTLRTRAVGIGGSVYVPIALPQRVEELFGFVLELASEVTDPFEQAFFLMVHLPYLQPFEDANKRVSRLAANIPLIRDNLVPLSFLDVPERAYVDGLLGVYEMQRVELLRDVFTWAYERSCQQYAAVQSHLAPPDMFRLRHRVALSTTVRAIVEGELPANTSTIQAAMAASVNRTDRDQFVKLVLDEFRSLHAGNAIRFGVHPFEFDAWVARVTP